MVWITQEHIIKVSSYTVFDKMIGFYRLIEL